MLRMLLTLAALGGGLVSSAPAHPVPEARAAAQDPLVAKALQRIAQVEAAEKQLAAGDRAGATKQISQLGWAKKRLNAVVQQNTAEWKGAMGRHDACLARLEKKRDAPPAPNPGPAPKPAPAPKPGSGGTPPAPKPAPKPAPAPTGQPPAKAYDHAKVVRLNEDIQREYNNTKDLPIKLFLDDNRMRGLEKSVARFKERAAAFPETHPNVKVVLDNIALLDNLVTSASAKIAADRKAAPAILEQLDALWEKYDEEKYPTRIYPPFNETQLRSWAREIRQRRDEKIPGDLQWIETWKNNVEVGYNRYLSAQSNLTGSIQRRLEEAELVTVQTLDGQCSDAVEFGEWLLGTDPKDRNQVISRVLGKGRFDENMLRLREGLDDVELARMVDGELLRKDAPDRTKQKESLERASEHLQRLVRLTLSEVRMPKPVSEDPALLKTAAETLRLEKYEIAGWERLVVNAPLKKQTRREAWFSSSGARGTITFYDYTWEQFQVTTAEKVGDEVWLFANTLKRYESGDPTTPVGEWILSRRFELTPILAENLDR
ncbi:MAG: hypothetical protein AAFU73_04165 [Planctomycetota bacterium]